jgi:hypothetical protein
MSAGHTAARRYTAPMRRWPAFVPLLLAACTLTIHSSSAFHSYTQIGLVGRTGSDELEVCCPAEAAWVRLTAKIRPTAGCLYLRLVDPSGTCRHDEVVAAACEHELELPPMPGPWLCAVTYAAFDGDCALELRSATDDAVTLRFGAAH